MAYVQGESRNQTFLLPPSIDEYVSETNPVRVIDAFVDSLDLEALGFSRTKPAWTGRPAYDPRDLLKLYIYGYVNRIRSSRRLMRECQCNLEAMFLLRRLQPDFRTISDFRKENPKGLKKMFQVFTKVCVELNLYKQLIVAVDGTKIRAVNSKDNCYTTDVLLKKIATIDAHISDYLEAMDQIDEAEADDEPSKEKIQEILDTYKQRKIRYESYVEELAESGEKQLLTTDPEARRMHSKDGFHCSYNIQTAVDSESHLICAYEVTNHNTDQGLLNDMAESTKEALETDVLEFVADKGYESRQDILHCLMNGSVPHVALKYDKEMRVFNLPYEATDITEDMRADTSPESIQTCLHAGVLPQAYEDKGVSVEVQIRNQISCFIRHPDGSVTCPTMQVFNYVKQHSKGGKIYKNKDACRQCTTRCTTAQHKEVCFANHSNCIAVYVAGPLGMPFQELPDGFVPHNSFRRRDQKAQQVVLTIPLDKSKLRIRKSTVEHPFGTIKWYHGAHFALLKGKLKVSGEFALSFLSYNLTRAIGLVGAPALLEIFQNKDLMRELCQKVS